MGAERRLPLIASISDRHDPEPITRISYEAAGANALRLEIVRRNPNAVGFEVIKRRRVVERTFSWFGRNRRLAKDVENLASTLLAFVTLAAIQFGIRRLAR